MVKYGNVGESETPSDGMNKISESEHELLNLNSPKHVKLLLQRQIIHFKSEVEKWEKKYSDIVAIHQSDKRFVSEYKAAKQDRFNAIWQFTTATVMMGVGSFITSVYPKNDDIVLFTIGATLSAGGFIFGIANRWVAMYIWNVYFSKDSETIPLYP